MLGARGAHYLADGRVEGDDPLAPFSPTAPRHLLRTDGFEHVADIMVGSFYDPELEEGCAFEELICFHGGIGGQQTRPFILHPAHLEVPPGPIVGAASVHGILASWRRGLQARPDRRTQRTARPRTRTGAPMTKWKIATAVLAVVAVGLGIWAFSLQSDIDDKDAQIASQQQQLDEQQDVASRVQGTATATQEEVQAAVDRAEQAATEAKASAGDAVEQAQARADEAAARAEAAGACARGYISALTGALEAASVSGGVEQAKSDIEALSGSCSETFDSK